MFKLAGMRRQTSKKKSRAPRSANAALQLLVPLQRPSSEAPQRAAWAPCSAAQRPGRHRSSPLECAAAAGPGPACAQPPAGWPCPPRPCRWPATRAKRQRECHLACRHTGRRLPTRGCGARATYHFGHAAALKPRVHHLQQPLAVRIDVAEAAHGALLDNGAGVSAAQGGKEVRQAGQTSATPRHAALT